MESFLVCFHAVAPLFLIMALGYLAQRLGTVPRESVPRLNKIGFRYFLPVTLFYSIYTSDISQTIQPKLLLFSLLAILAEYALAVAYVLLTEKDPEKQGVKIQGIYRSNFVLLGIPLASALVEGADLGPVALMVVIIVPLFNASAVITLEVFHGRKPDMGKVLLNIIKNPLIVASAVGLLFLLTSLRLPTVLELTIKQLSPVSSGYMIFLLGAFFRFDGLHRYRKDLIQVSLGRLVILPGLLLTVAFFLGIRGVGFVGLIAALGSATAVSSFTMTQEMGGDSELAGDIVVVTSALCILTMFGWSFLFKTLGSF